MRFLRNFCADLLGMSIGESLLRDLGQPYIYHTHILYIFSGFIDDMSRKSRTGIPYTYLFLQSLIHSVFIPLLSVFTLKPVCKDAVLNLKKIVLRVLWLPSDSGALYLSGQVF